MKLGQKLRLLRKKNRLTQVKISEGICSVSYYSKIENSIVVPSEEIILLLAEKLKVSVYKLKEKEKSLIVPIKVALDIYQLIRNEQHKEALNLYKTLLDKYENSIDPSIQLILKLLELRFELSKPKDSLVQVKYEEVNNLKEFNSQAIIPLYNRIYGLYHYLYGDINKALSLYKVLEEFEKHEQKGDVLYNLSLIFNRKNEIYTSIKYLEQALEIYTKNLDYQQCTNCYLLLGVNYSKMGYYETAIEYYNKVVKVTQEKEIIRKVYHNLGVAYERLNKVSVAIDYYQKSLELKNENEINILGTLYSLSNIYYKDHKYSLSLKYVKKGINLAKDYNIQEYQIKFTILDLQINNLDIKKYLEEIAIPYAKKRREKSLLIKYLSLLGDQYAISKNYKDAYFLYKKVFDLKGCIT